MNLKLIEKQIDHRRDVLIHYMPTSFFRNNIEKSFTYFISNPILELNEGKRLFSVNIEGEEYNFIYEFLNWDSDFFKTPTFKLNFCALL